MKTFIQILKWTFIVLLVAIGAFLIFVFSNQGKVYDAPYPDISATTDSTDLARGEYLVYGPAHCSGCHSPMENQMGIREGKHLPLKGGFLFDLPVAKLYSPNITPDEETGIGKLTDQQIARSLRYGVGYDGRAIFDFMPFHNLCDDDLRAVISYMRSQEPVKNAIPPRELNLLGKIIYATIIKPVGPEEGVEIPKSVHPDTTSEYGHYLATYVANCRGCHTNRDLKTGAYIGDFYAGGFAMPSGMEPGKAVVSPNLTPEPETGRIAGWSEQKFIERMRQGRVIPISEMPWEQFQQMTDNDLKAIYAFLQTLPAVKNDPGPTIIDLK